MCPRIPDRITLRDSSGGWVPQLLVTSLSRRRHSFHCDREHIRRVPPASISRHLRLGAPISVRQHQCPLNPRVGPLSRAWVRWYARGRRRPEARPHHHQMGGIALHEDPCVTCLPMTSPPNGGNCTIRGATRRRHADGRLLMLQNPHLYPWRHAPSPVQDCPAGRR